MSKLLNKQTQLKATETDFANYGLLLIQCLNVVTKGGISVLEMSKRIDLIKYIDSINTNDYFDFKAEDVLYIKELYQQMQWSGMHEDIINLWNDLSNL
jgi:hypothetical protein